MTTDDLRWQARVSGWECGVQLDLDALQQALLHDPNRLPLLASLSSGGVTSPNTAPPRLGTFPALDFQLTSGLQSPRLYPRLHSSLPLPYRRWEERFDPLPKRRAERVSGSSDPEGSPDGSRSSSPVADSFRSARSNLTVASTELRPALNTTPLLDTSSAPAGAASSPAPEIALSEIAPPATATVTALPSAPATAPITPSRPSPKTSSSALLDDRARAEMGANEAAPPPAAVRTVSFATSDVAVTSRSISFTSDVAATSRSISLPAPSAIDAVHAPLIGLNTSTAAGVGAPHVATAAENQIRENPIRENQIRENQIRENPLLTALTELRSRRRLDLQGVAEMGADGKPMRTRGHRRITSEPLSFSFVKQSIVQSGWLWKYSRRHRSWRRRWFVLRAEGELRWFKTPEACMCSPRRPTPLPHR